MSDSITELIKQKNELLDKIAELEKGIEEIVNDIAITRQGDDFLVVEQIYKRLQSLLSNHPESVDKTTDIVDKEWHEYDDIVDKKQQE